MFSWVAGGATHDGPRATTARTLPRRAQAPPRVAAPEGTARGRRPRHRHLAGGAARAPSAAHFAAESIKNLRVLKELITYRVCS